MKQNVLIIQTDQQARWTLGCYGGDEVQTPFIDSLCEQGVRFAEFYTPSAVCTPSRGCFVTGRYPHAHGAYRNGEGINAEEVTFAHRLKQAGYETGYVGKWHLAPKGTYNWLTTKDSMGFDKCQYMINGVHQKMIIEREGQQPELSYETGDEMSYTTDWLTTKMIAMLKEKHDKPFCYMLSIPDPHQPYRVRPPYDTMFDPAKVKLPVSFTEEILPDWAQYDEWGRKRYFPIEMKEREAKLRQIKSQYLGEVKCIDDNIGRILNVLEEEGLMDNTMIIFVTDHGEYMGEHGLLEKNNLYDTVYHIPCIIKSKQLFEQNYVVSQYVNIVDFQPTLLALLGVEASGREQGKDVSGLIAEPDTAWEDVVFIHPNDVPRAGIITPKYELAYVDKGWQTETIFKEHILFDRKKDPHQLVNLYKDPAYQEVIQDLTKRMVAHYKEVEIPVGRLPQIIQQAM